MAGAAYWIGNDGNIYLKDSGGTRNMGPAGANVTRPDAGGFYDPWADNAQEALRIDAQQIANPSGGGGKVQGAATTAPNGGAQTAAKAVLNQGAIDNTQRTINEIPALLDAALQSERARYGNTVADFGRQEEGQRKTYDTSTTTNQQNYDSNFMDSIRSGIKGLGGLMQILRGTGAAGGTVEGQVQDVVGGVTSNDIRTGADTQKENQTALDTSLSGFLTDLDRKRRANEDTVANNERAIRRDSNTQLQDLYGKMAGYFGDANRVSEASNFMSKAGALTPSIAADSRTQVGNYDTTPIAVQAPQLTAFAAPTQPNVVTAPSDGQVGSGIFTMGEKRRKDPALAPAAAGV